MDHSVAKVLQQTEEVISMVYKYVEGVAQVPVQGIHRTVDPWDLVRELRSLRHVLTRGFPLEVLKDFSREDGGKLEYCLRQFNGLLRKLHFDLELVIENSGPLSGFEYVPRELVRIKDALVLEFRLDDTSWGKDRWVPGEVQALSPSRGTFELPRFSGPGFGDERKEGLLTPMNLLRMVLKQGRWAEAGKLQAQVVKERSELLGNEHPDTLDSIASLASTYYELGQWAEAEALQLQVLEARRRSLGENHSGTLASMSNLASTYRNRGQLVEAEELQVRVLEMSKQILGEYHPNTRNSMANLASTFLDQGRGKEAQELQLRVLKMNKSALNEGHPEILASMTNLASTYCKQGRWKEAKKLERQVLKTNKRQLGKEHSKTLASMTSLASTYHEHGWWSEAEQLQLQVLEVRRRVLGEEHPDTLTSMTNLASTYYEQSWWNKAEQLQSQVLKVQRRVLGEEHPDTLTSMTNLASTYYEHGWWNKAEQLQSQVLKVQRRVLGEEHPDTLTSMTNLASTYYKQSRWDKAEQLQSQVLKVQRRVLGEERPDTLTSMTNLALTYYKHGRLRKAEQLQSQVLKVQRRVLGEEHPDTLTSTALPYRDQDRPGVAERHLEPSTSAPSTSHKQDQCTVTSGLNNTSWEAPVSGLWPQELPNRPYRGIMFEPYSLSWFDRVGAWVERELGTPIYWWPFSSPIYSKEHGLVRMSWECGCGTVLSSIVSTDIAERYQQLCSSHSPQDATPGAPAQAPTSSGSTVSQVLVDELPSRPSAVLARSGRSPPQHNSPALSNLSRAQPSQPCVSSATYILCCIRKSSIRKRQRRTVLAQVLKQPSTNDREFFQTLKLEYLRIRGWRRWISLSTVKRIKFVRFVRYYRDFVACYSTEELPPPTDQDYEYIPKPPANPPIFLAEEFLHYFEEPSCAGVSTDCLDLMPKKVTGRLADGKRVEAWGIQTQETLSGLRFALLLLVIWLGMFVFAVWWLVRHHGDLQNAFAPANYFTACAAACIVIPQALRFYSDHWTRP